MPSQCGLCAKLLWPLTSETVTCLSEMCLCSYLCSDSCFLLFWWFLGIKKSWFQGAQRAKPPTWRGPSHLETISNGNEIRRLEPASQVVGVVASVCTPCLRNPWSISKQLCSLQPATTHQQNQKSSQTQQQKTSAEKGTNPKTPEETPKEKQKTCREQGSVLGLLQTSPPRQPPRLGPRQLVSTCCASAFAALMATWRERKPPASGASGLRSFCPSC